MHFDRKNVASGIVTAAVCFCLALNFYLNLTPNSFAPNLLRQLQDRDGLFRELANIDRLYYEIPPDQNVFLSFEDFPLENEAFVELVCYRSHYAAYPHKVFTSAPGTVINRGRDILHAPFAPNEDWLDQQRVSRIVTFAQKADGQIAVSETDRHLR